MSLDDPLISYKGSQPRQGCRPGQPGRFKEELWKGKPEEVTHDHDLRHDGVWRCSTIIIYRHGREVAGDCADGDR
jgi:hypothetical protein